MKQKHIIALLSALALTASASAQVLIGGVGFEELAYDGFTYDLSGSSVLGSTQSFYSDVTGDRLATVQPGTFNSLVRVYWDGTNGASDWSKEAALATVGSVGGFYNTSTVGETLTRSLAIGATTFDAASVSDDQAVTPALYVDRGVAFKIDDGFSASIGINAAGYSLSSLSFTALTDSSNITLSWGLWNGTSTTSLGLSSLITGSTMTSYTVDLTGANLTGALTLVAMMTGTDGAVLSFDNLQVQGLASASAVPEPSTYAAILGAAALGFVGLRRRAATLRA